MLLEPGSLASDHARLEEIEKVSMRLVSQAILDFRQDAKEIFVNETDKPQDFAEDITREALDRLGVSRIDQRLFGNIDYKRARYVFHPDYAVRQALFVDSKAEKGDPDTATLQTSQTSMRIRHVRAGTAVDEQGKMPQMLTTGRGKFITTTIFVKYHYDDIATGGYQLNEITVFAVPSGLLQVRYNPSPTDTIWRAGRNAPSRGEDFRVRVVFSKLKQKTKWRVQIIPLAPNPFVWDE